MRAADVMTPDPVCVSPDASIIDAIRLMLERASTCKRAGARSTM